MTADHSDSTVSLLVADDITVAALVCGELDFSEGGKVLISAAYLFESLIYIYIPLVKYRLNSTVDSE